MRPSFPADVRPLLAGLALALLAPASIAQAPQAPHDPLTSMLPDAKGALAWSLLGKTAIRKVDGKLAPDFPSALRPLTGTTVTASGATIPPTKLVSQLVSRPFPSPQPREGCGSARRVLLSASFRAIRVFRG